MAETIRHTMKEITDLYNNAPCGYHSLDEDGLIIRINDTELSWLGYDRESIIGKMNFQDLLSPAGREQFQHESKNGGGRMPSNSVRKDYRS